jgi:excisionase family DNA binding protein
MEPNINSLIEHDRLLNADDVAKLFKISKSMAYKLIREGEIPAIKLGRLVRVRRSDLAAFINDNVRFD